MFGCRQPYVVFSVCARGSNELGYSGSSIKITSETGTRRFVDGTTDKKAVNGRGLCRFADTNRERTREFVKRDDHSQKIIYEATAVVV